MAFGFHAFGRRTLRQAIGSSLLSASVTRRPITESAVSWTLQVRSVSFSVMPLRRFTTQKPLSFIQERNIAPKPIAVKRYTGWQPSYPAATIGAMIEEVVSMATVAEPCATRTTAAVSQPRKIKFML